MESSKFAAIRTLLILTSTAFLTGCGAKDPLDRQAIEGKVTFQGAPLDEGMIQFMPLAQSGHALASGAPIANGSYAIPQNRGLPPGEYKVMIFSAGAATANEQPGELAPPREERIPPEFNAESKTTITVVAEEAKPFDFDIP